MRPLQLNFSHLALKRQQQLKVIILLLLVVIALVIVIEHNNIKEQIATIESSISNSSNQKAIKQTKPTENDLIRIKQAQFIQQKLNFPWQTLLNSLELVKQSSAAIRLTAIQPDTSKNVVLISGEAATLQEMLAFVALLEKQTTFYDVFLINQRRLQQGDNQAIAFTLKMGWHI